MAGSAFDAIKGILGDDAEEKIKAALSTISSGNNEAAADTDTGSEISVTGPAADNGVLESVMQIKNIVDNIAGERDLRTNLLMSLKPYMRDSRRQSIDTVIRMLNLSKLSVLFRQ